MSKQYYKWINIAKGVGIILVVFGHAIADMTSSDYFFSKFFWFIYSFHMPLFFFLSGYCGSKALEITTPDTKYHYILERFKRLMVPYFFIGCVYIPIKLFLSDHITSKISIRTIIGDMFLGNNPNSQLWTLYALFLSSATIALFANNCRKEKIGGGGGYSLLLIGAAIVSGMASIYMPAGFFRNASGDFPFYVLGAFARRSDFEKILNRKVFFICAFLLCVINFFVEIHSDNPLRFATGILGIICICFIGKYAEDSNSKIASLMEITGKFSMDIYIMANLVQVAVRVVLLKKLMIPQVICCFISTISGVLIPIIASHFIIRKLKIMRILVLGDFKKR